MLAYCLLVLLLRLTSMACLSNSWPISRFVSVFDFFDASPAPVLHLLEGLVTLRWCSRGAGTATPALSTS
jgi:hypothetical protein